MGKRPLFIGFSIVIAIFVLLALRQVQTRLQQGHSVIVVGAILPLSGSGADQGEWQKRGLDLAADEINRAQSRWQLQIIYEDSAGDTEKAVASYRYLQSRYRVPIVFTWGSGIAMAIAPLANQDHIVQMGIATAVPTYSSPDDFNFRNFPSATAEAAYLADVVHKRSASRIAILKIHNDYGVGSAKAFRSQYEQNGGTVLADEAFEPKTKDFRTQLTKVKTLNVPLVYLASYPTEGALLLRQARELGLNNTFIASVAISGGKSFFNLVGDSAEGLLVVSSVPLLDGSKDVRVQKFLEAYRQKNHEELGSPQLYTVRAYDALRVVATTFDQCAPSVVSADCIKNALAKVHDYQGIGGIISFDRNGDIEAMFHLQQIRNGRFVTVE